MSRTRMSRGEAESGRRKGSVRFFLTGGTGFLGSHAAVALLRKGHRVILMARPAGGRPARDRVERLLDWFGLPREDRGGLRVVEGDITRPDLGFGTGLAREILRETDEIIHCASNTSFSERKRTEVEAVNRDGLSHVLGFARAGRARFFHHVSTAFVAGKVEGPCPEAPVTAEAFHNVYEETKCRGERLAAQVCREAGIGLTIYRPSIVYGDSRTGRSLLFNAVYYPVRAALFLKESYEKDIRERGGRKAAEVGVRMEPDGTMHLPLRIETAASGGINLVPVDHFTAAFVALLEEAADGRIFHIVNSRRTTVEDIIDYSRRLFRMSGVRACAPEEFASSPKNPLESLYDHYIEAYGPYMRDTRIFETDDSGPILESRGVACPEFDYEVFRRCMTFAIDVGWGAGLFDPAKSP